MQIFQVPFQAYRFSLQFNKILSDSKLLIYFGFITVEWPFPEGRTTNFASPRNLSTPSIWVAATLSVWQMFSEGNICS